MRRSHRQTPRSERSGAARMRGAGHTSFAAAAVLAAGYRIESVDRRRGGLVVRLVERRRTSDRRTDRVAASAQVRKSRTALNETLARAAIRLRADGAFLLAVAARRWALCARLFNADFGVGSAANVYYAACRLRDTLFSLIAGGVLSSAMIPVLLPAREDGEVGGAHLANLVLITRLPSSRWSSSARRSRRRLLGMCWRPGSTRTRAVWRRT
jgi:hypothetical protein